VAASQAHRTGQLYPLLLPLNQFIIEAAGTIKGNKLEEIYEKFIITIDFTYIEPDYSRVFFVKIIAPI
jgi:hypothetical protein